MYKLIFICKNTDLALTWEIYQRKHPFSSLVFNKSQKIYMVGKEPSENILDFYSFPLEQKKVHNRSWPTNRKESRSSLNPSLHKITAGNMGNSCCSRQGHGVAIPGAPTCAAGESARSKVFSRLSHSAFHYLQVL